MGARGVKQKPVFLKVHEPRVSPDDVKYLLNERDQRAAADTRTEAERWLGDPPKYRSALAQRKNTAPVINAYARLWTFTASKRRQS
jgi:hypothetical protein